MVTVDSQVVAFKFVAQWVTRALFLLIPLTRQYDVQAPRSLELTVAPPDLPGETRGP
jgi:hypothetical protein